MRPKGSKHAAMVDFFIVSFFGKTVLVELAGVTEPSPGPTPSWELGTKKVLRPQRGSVGVGVDASGWHLAPTHPSPSF